MPSADSGMRERHQIRQLPIRRLLSNLVNEGTPVHLAVRFAVRIVVAVLNDNVRNRKSVGGVEKGLGFDLVHASVIGPSQKNFRN